MWFLSISWAYFYVNFDSFLILLDRSNFIFYKQIGISSAFFTILCHSLRFISQSLLTQIFFFCLILGQRFKGFLLNPKVRHVFSFFLIKLHAFMHFSCILLKFSHQRKIGVFDDFLHFGQIWFMGFCSCIILTWSTCFNFIIFKICSNFRN